MKLEEDPRNLRVIMFILITLAIFFFGGMVFGERYIVEEESMNYSCMEIKEMIILDDFEYESRGWVSIRTFYGNVRYTEALYNEEYYREYYVSNCSQKQGSKKDE